MIRVGRCSYTSQGKIIYPSYENFTPIIIMMKSHSKYYPLSPYFLKDNKSRIMENIWQFSKCYKSVPNSIQRKSRYDNTIIWQHPSEIHLDDNDNMLPEYINWRNKGMNNKDPIRYPATFEHKSKCKFALVENNGEIGENKLNYIEARKAIYLPLYCEMVKQEKLFHDLKQRLQKGENLLIIEVDGPHQESLNYYKVKYNVDDTFIEQDSMLINDKNINIMLNDEKHAFGHGYCIGMALLEMNKNTSTSTGTTSRLESLENRVTKLELLISQLTKYLLFL